MHTQCRIYALSSTAYGSSLSSISIKKACSPLINCAESYENNSYMQRQKSLIDLYTTRVSLGASRFSLQSLTDAL